MIAQRSAAPNYGDVIGDGGAFPGYQPFFMRGYRTPGVVFGTPAQLWSGVAAVPTTPPIAGAITANVRLLGDVGSAVRCQYLNASGELREAGLVAVGAVGVEQPMFEMDGAVVSARAASGGRILNAWLFNPIDPSDRNQGAIDFSIDDLGVPRPQVRVPAPLGAPNIECCRNVGYAGSFIVPMGYKLVLCGAGTTGRLTYHFQFRTMGRNPFFPVPAEPWRTLFSLNSSDDVNGPGSALPFSCGMPHLDAGSELRIMGETALVGPMPVGSAYAQGRLIPNLTADSDPSKIPSLI